MMALPLARELAAMRPLIVAISPAWDKEVLLFMSGSQAEDDAGQMALGPEVQGGQLEVEREFVPVAALAGKRGDGIKAHGGPQGR